MSQFEIIETPLAGCFEIKPKIHQDNRGRFVKLFHSMDFSELKLVDRFEEQYYAVSNQGVLRGMHFQLPPFPHIKLVTCVSGALLDVVVDLRKSSSTYLQWHRVELNGQTNHMLYVPEGFAHGYYVLEDQTVFVSMNSRKYIHECDSGIHWDSFGFAWPDKRPIVSDKDRNLIKLADFESPF